MVSWMLEEGGGYLGFVRNAHFILGGRGRMRKSVKNGYPNSQLEF